MILIEANITPETLDSSSHEEEEKTIALENYLKSLGLFETKDEIHHREEIVKMLRDTIRNCVKGILSAKNLYTNQEPEELASLYTFGSFRMMVNEPSADIDTMCVGPGAISREEFFNIVSAALRVDGNCSDVSVIDTAFVPIITMKYGGIDIDLSYSPIMRYQTRLPHNFDILDDENLRNVDDETVRSLNGRRVTDTILELVPNKKTFRLVLKAFRHFAKKRGIYKNVTGYLGGVNCALLCCYACLRYPNMAAAVVLHHCFRIFAEWNWENPVVVKDVQLNPELGHDKDVWNPTNERCRKDLFPILTPCYPSQNSTYNVMTCTRDVMIKEFQRARDLTRKILDGSKSWATLFEEIPFFTSYKYFIQIEVSAESESVFSDWYGFVESQIRHYARNLERNKSISIRVYPTSFKVPSRECCRQFYIAFTLLEEAKGKPLDLSAVTQQFKSNLYHDYLEKPVKVEIVFLKNTSKVNELPDFLFPEGKTLRHHGKRSRKLDKDGKRPKVESSLC